MENQESAGNWCERLYEEKAAGLILYGRALGLGHGEAEDAVQETFVALLQLAEPPANPPHYAIRAFRNRALNVKRGLFRRLARELESIHWFEAGAAGSELETAAEAALAKLPADQREVIVLKVWHGQTFEAAAEILGASPNTVAGRYRYGMQKLRTILKGSDYERLDERIDRAETGSLAPAPPFGGPAAPHLCL